jgi:hypothetical protein
MQYRRPLWPRFVLTRRVTNTCPTMQGTLSDTPDLQFEAALYRAIASRCLELANTHDGAHGAPRRLDVIEGDQQPAGRDLPRQLACRRSPKREFRAPSETRPRQRRRSNRPCAVAALASSRPAAHHRACSGPARVNFRHSDAAAGRPRRPWSSDMRRNPTADQEEVRSLGRVAPTNKGSSYVAASKAFSAAASSAPLSPLGNR